MQHARHGAGSTPTPLHNTLFDFTTLDSQMMTVATTEYARPMNDAPTTDTEGIAILPAEDDGDDDGGPVRTYAKTYLDPEGNRWRVMTEWWEGSAPEGRDSDPAPDMPGHVVTQYCYRFMDGVICRPVSRAASSSSPSSPPSSGH